MRILPFVAVFALAFAVLGSTQSGAAPKKNVLWIYLEDTSGWFGCYGDKIIETPNIDALAASGVRFDRFYTPAGVCSAMRSATITGMMQTSIGAHHHRSCRPVFRGKPMGDYDQNVLPEDVVPVPILFRQAGYYTFNEGGGKDDFNFDWDPEAFYDHRNNRWNFKGAKDGSDWTGCPDGKPWFGQIQLAGGKLGKKTPNVVDRAKVPVPPYYPDIPEVREEIAHHYDCLIETDKAVGQIIAALKRDGLYENTAIFMFSDHGYKLHRHKQYLYEGGIHMPCTVSGPGVEAGGVRDDLVSSIDIAAASLAAAGLAVPESMEGRDFMAKDYQPREFVISARDRCDYTYERIRAVVTPRFKYLRNYLTDRPFMNPSYKDPWPVSQALRKMMAAGEMNDTQLVFFGDTKPPEELYDLENDPHEINNLAGDPKFKAELERHRKILAGWITESGDQGQEVESDVGLLCALKRWGDKCVNPEYDRVRPAYEKWKAEQKARGEAEPKPKPKPKRQRKGKQAA
jgi:arylsulfatase A-like enzyme